MITCQSSGFQQQPETLEPQSGAGLVSLRLKLKLKKKGEANIQSLLHSLPPPQPRRLPHKSYSPSRPLCTRCQGQPPPGLQLNIKNHHFGKTVMIHDEDWIEGCVMYICVLCFRHILQDYSMCSILHSTGVCI